MTVFSRQIATAKRLINKYGENCTWRVIPDPVAPDNTKPWKVVPGTPQDYANIKVAFFPFTRMQYQVAQQDAGSEIQIGDEYGLLAQQAFKPANTDVVIRSDGSESRIYKMNPLRPDGTDIIYEIWFKL